MPLTKKRFVQPWRRVLFSVASEKYALVCKRTPPFPPLNGMTTLWSYFSLFY